MKEMLQELFFGWYYCLKGEHLWDNKPMGAYRRECCRCGRVEHLDVKRNVWVYFKKRS